VQRYWEARARVTNTSLSYTTPSFPRCVLNRCHLPSISSNLHSASSPYPPTSFPPSFTVPVSSLPAHPRPPHPSIPSSISPPRFPYIYVTSATLPLVFLSIHPRRPWRGSYRSNISLPLLLCASSPDFRADLSFTETRKSTHLALFFADEQQQIALRAPFAMPSPMVCVLLFPSFLPNPATSTSHR
jgi:hypothetical protein